MIDVCVVSVEDRVECRMVKIIYVIEWMERCFSVGIIDLCMNGFVGLIFKCFRVVIFEVF